MTLKKIWKSNLVTILLLSIVNLTPKISIAQDFIPGQTYYDHTGHVEYRAGNLPIILSAPHGGNLKPTTIPDRDCTGCSYLKDTWTKEITEGIYDEYVEQTGCYPHVIINLLHRVKFDANRAIGDAADGNLSVEEAWHAYHNFIDIAKTQLVSDYDKGLFLDIHGHAHDIERIELGYLLTGSELRLSDTELNTTSFIEESSIKHLVNTTIQGLSHSDLLRGTTSFGSLMSEQGFQSVPSLNDPFPDVGESYFNGGYNTQRHGSRDNTGTIDAIQIELNSDIRFKIAKRELLIESLTYTANQYINYHYNATYLNNFCTTILSNHDLNSGKQKIEIYPNPSNTVIHIKSQHTPITKIEIYNACGQTLKIVNNKFETISVSELTTGIYLMTIFTAQGTLNKRMVKK